MANAGAPTPTVEEMNGTLVSKDITVDGHRQRRRTARRAEKNYVMTAQRAIVKSDRRRTPGQVDHHGHKAGIRFGTRD